MDQLLQQIVAGLETGSIYALIGMAIVVIMKSTDVPNFAMAEMGLVAAYLTWWLSNETTWLLSADSEPGWPFGVAVVLGLAFAAVFGAFIEFFLVKPLTGSSTLPVAVFSAVGLGGSLIYLFNTKGLPGFLDWIPGAEGGFPLGVAIVLAVATVPLTFWFMYRAVKKLDVIDHFPLLLLTIGLGFALGAVIEIVFGAGAQRFTAPCPARPSTSVRPGSVGIRSFPYRWASSSLSAWPHSFVPSGVSACGPSPRTAPQLASWVSTRGECLLSPGELAPWWPPPP